MPITIHFKPALQHSCKRIYSIAATYLSLKHRTQPIIPLAKQILRHTLITEKPHDTKRHSKSRNLFGFHSTVATFQWGIRARLLWRSNTVDSFT